MTLNALPYTLNKMAKIVTHQDTRSFFGEEDLLQEAQSKSFPQLIFEMLSEKVPSEQELAIFELILNLSIDHGTDTPSTKKVIEEAEKGETISEAVSEGIEEINNAHGGAIEPCMEILYRVQGKGVSVKDIIEEKLAKDEKLPGFGHRIYKDLDPRAELIMEKLAFTQGSEEFIKIIYDLKNELKKQTGKDLVINIDGAIAVALCVMGWEPRLGKAVFIIARTPGLCAHFLNNSSA